MHRSMTAGFASLAVICAAILCGTASGQEHKTVIGPTNIDLAAGAEMLKSGDLVITLGAGDVTGVGDRLLEQLRSDFNGKRQTPGKGT